MLKEKECVRKKRQRDGRDIVGLDGKKVVLLGWKFGLLKSSYLPGTHLLIWGYQEHSLRCLP